MKSFRLIAAHLAKAGLLCLALASGPAYGQADSTPADTASAATAPTAYPVIFGRDTIFDVARPLGPFSADERARAIMGRIGRLADDPLTNLDSITPMDAPEFTGLFIGDVMIMSVTDSDAAAAGVSRQELARRYAKGIAAAVDAERRATSLRAVLTGAGFALLVTLALIVALYLLRGFGRRVLAVIESWRGTRIKGLKVQNLEIATADRITDSIKSLAKGFGIVLVLVLLYFYIPLVFSFFPWTRGLASVLFGYVLSPLKLVWQSFVDYLPKLFFVVVIAFVTRYLLKFLRFLFTEVGRGRITIPGFYTEWSDSTYKIARFVIIAFAVVVAFPYLPGADQPAFKGVSIFIGLLFSLGSASAVANVIAGVVLTYMRPFRKGDRVRIADTAGDVVEKTLLTTRVRTIKNVIVTIPNALVLGSHIINYSASSESGSLILHTAVTIGYDAPWRQVHELLISAAKVTAGIVATPEPFVLQTALDDFYVRYELNAHTDQPTRMAAIYSELHQNIQDRFNEAGLEIMSPHYAAVRDGHRTAIPDDYLPKSYRPPAFRLFGRVESPPPGGDA